MSIDNSKKIIVQQALHDAQHLKNVPTEVLEKLTLQYPWFAQAHQLLAKKYHIANHQKLNEQLQHAALLSLNRSELFNLIETDLITEKQKEKLDINLSIPIQTDKKIETKIIPEAPAPTEKSTLTKPEEIIPLKNNDLSSTLVEQEQITSKANQEVITDNNKIEASIENISPNSNIINTMSPSSETPKTFSTWLKKFNKGSNIGEPKTAVAKSEMKSKIEEGYNDEDNEADDLKIDFTEISSFGMQQREEFVTETMAKIYVDQEKYDKAISIYEKLCLLKPEKSVFFATRITELKNKI
ncbi:MAG: hypothetical protein RIQ33_930 [Bacteroidota bacterium]